MPDPRLTSGDAAAASEALWTLADKLIPAMHGMPAASSVEGAQSWLHYVLTVRHDLLPAVQRVMALVSEDDPAVVLAGLRESDPDCFVNVATVVISAYYMNPAVRKLIGYPGQEPTVASPAERGLGDDILGSAASRGPVYRQTPD